MIAGLSYELLRWAGKSDNIVVKILSIPGLYLQKVTTKEPDDSQLEVAIAAINAVLVAEGKKPATASVATAGGSCGAAAGETAAGAAGSGSLGASGTSGRSISAGGSTAAESLHEKRYSLKARKVRGSNGRQAQTPIDGDVEHGWHGRTGHRDVEQACASQTQMHIGRGL